MSHPVSGRRPLLAGNWKMNPTRREEAVDLARGVVEGGSGPRGAVDLLLIPPFPWLLPVADVLRGTRVELGAQDCFWEMAGAYTGEVSPAMLAGWCGWVLTGHSERRHVLGESDEWVSRKTRAALAEGLRVILCVGEQEKAFDAGQTDAVVSRQLGSVIDYLAQGDAARLAVAYEPVWAIGTGKNADPQHAYRTMSLIRELLEKAFGREAASVVRVLYGGSVNPANVASYAELPVCDGCLVGGASLKAPEFVRMIEVVEEVCRRDSEASSSSGDPGQGR